MDNANTTYTMTEGEKSFINGFVKSVRKEVFDYLVEVVKENAGIKDITLDALENWIGGMQADGISNVEKTLELISTKQETKWSDYLADNGVSGVITKESVVKYLSDNREEVKDILETIDIDSNDVPDYVVDSITDDWFSNAYTSDIISKISSNTDLRDFVKDCIDEL